MHVLITMMNVLYITLLETIKDRANIEFFHFLGMNFKKTTYKSTLLLPH